MKRNCNLELRLSQPPPPPPPQQQQLTIFYDGGISVCDVTELQARAIIWQASKQMDQERYKGRKEGREENGYSTASSWDPISPTSTLQFPSVSTSGMSMKKSLERFLQKRKHRQQANSPFKVNGKGR